MKDTFKDISIMTQKGRINDAKERMMGTHVYFGGFAARLRWALSRQIPTAATNGVKIWFNPDYTAKLSDRRLYGLCVHEVGHPALGHDLRRKGRDPKVWNIAADIALNLILLSEGITLPEGGLNMPTYAGKSAEDIYAELMISGLDGYPGDINDLRDNPRVGPEGGKRKGKKSEKSEDKSDDGTGKSGKPEEGTPEPGSDDGAGDEGDGEEDGEAGGSGEADGDDGAEIEEAGNSSGTDPGDPAEDDSNLGDLDDLENLKDEDFLEDDGEHQRDKEASSLDPETEWRIVSENLAAMAKRVGQMGGDMQGAIAAAQKTRVDWAPHLAALIENADNDDDYSWSRPSRRLSSANMLFPGDFNEQVKDIVIMVDTSGSMWDQTMMDTMSGEISGILKARSFEKAVVIYVDHMVQHVDTIDPRYEELEFQPHGGGGTSFAPSFVWLQDHPEIEPACVVYLTDMMGRFGDANLVPAYPTFWVNYGYSGATVPEHWEGSSTVVHADRHEM